ncbi:Gram-negative bacterial tonB protein [Marinomonas spartinae]|uniref:Protein TonB n=2 Tax=Marinomonas spartinae TaxID=1792290 RepID=A0A1A8TPY1_9GAMM|nr:Gram-negative bacterial tonB protein [Marinomonas spartinae]
MISKRHWLVAGGIAVSLHAAAFYGFFYQPSEGSKAPGQQGIEFDLGMMGDMGASKTNSVQSDSDNKDKKQVAKVEKTQKEVVKPEPKQEKVEKKPKPVVEKKPIPKPEKAPLPKTEPKPEPKPTPKKVVKEKPVIKPKPVVKEKQKSPIVVPKKEPKKIPKKEPKKEVVKKVEPKKVIPKLKPKKAEPKKTLEQAASTTASKPISQQSTSQNLKNSGARSQASQKATTGVGNAASSGGHKGAITSYYSKLAAVLAQHKRYPRAARRRHEEGVVTVSFVVHADGQVTNTNIIKSSGYRRLDDAVLDMLKRASPLPKFSPDMNKSSLTITLPVSYKLSDY